MRSKARMTISARGQITLPADLRRRWHVRPGDQITVEFESDTQGRIEITHSGSLFEQLEDLKLPALGRMFTQEDIDTAIGEVVQARRDGERG